MMGRAIELDFSETKPMFRKNGQELSLSPKQLRARARRKRSKGKSTREEFKRLYKPIEEWDTEELARGRPRSADGTFTGRPPAWIGRDVHERATELFIRKIREDVYANAADAIGVVKMLMHSDETDPKGKPLVPASVKLQAAQWLTEHVIGKPTQKVEQDISIKLQGVLAQAMLMPGELPGPVTPMIQSTPETAEGIWDTDGYEDDDEE
jgi:hypothetical protein